MAGAQNDWDILGHEWAISLLKGQLRRAQSQEQAVSHAYLFSGAKGVGRRTLALRFAQALNCPNPLNAGTPCRTCRTCQQIEQMKHPDLTVIQAAQEGGTLKVEQIRDLQHQLALAPYAARYRIALLLRFEEAHPSAANALLKNLEEPPPQVIFLLTANSPQSVLPTILSRCQVLRLNPPPRAYTAQGLHAHWQIPLAEAHTLTHISGSRPGYALWLHNHPEVLEQRHEMLDKLQWLFTANRVERFSFASDIADYRGKDPEKKAAMQLQLNETLLTWLSFGRDVLLLSSNRTEETHLPVINLDRLDEMRNLAHRLDVHTAYCMVVSLERALQRLERNVNARLALETLFLDLPGLR